MPPSPLPGKGRLRQRSGITKGPGVLAQRNDLVDDRQQSRIDSQAGLADLLEIMRASERLVVEGEECLEGLLHGLLAVEKGVADERRLRRQIDLRAAQVFGSRASYPLVSATKMGSSGIQ
jgi:hypothetical protein